ncbi:MAG TPA: glycogen synthase [Polyangiaceae bacterium]|nr:glycogen synthase [Polyangiaceae bacterium]
MRVLFVASEVAPFAKTGGLGDVAGALPQRLAERGHDVRVVMPLYPRVRAHAPDLETVVSELSIELGGTRVVVSILEGVFPGTRAPVYFVRCPGLYDRPSIYTQDPDEHLRFVVLSWASLLLCQRLGFSPDIVHANDWQTALLPLLLKTAFAWDRLFDRTRSVLTIHNIGHQGAFDARVLGETGLAGSAQHFHQDQLREGRINFLLTGILYANALTTVSPTYALEIQRPEHGAGLDAFLRERAGVLFGILNGVDENDWSPENDAHIAQRYSVDSLEGKEVNKRDLVRSAGLAYHSHVLVFGVVSRLAWQKGFDLCFGVLPRVLARRPVQLVVLGTGEPKYEDFFRGLSRQFPSQVAYRAAFSEPLAHKVEAGADSFLMPSRYEPCGLNQMYSLRYGTPPVVHRTGGLADTVTAFDRRTGEGNGFVFEHFDEAGFAYGVDQALRTWGTGRGEDRARWQRVQRNGMRLRFGWDERVTRYEQIYRSVQPPGAPQT